MLPARCRCGGRRRGGGAAAPASRAPLAAAAASTPMAAGRVARAAGGGGPAIIEHAFPECGRAARFPATGSGLLWARTTGLKVWPAARVLSAFLLDHGPAAAGALRAREPVAADLVAALPPAGAAAAAGASGGVPQTLSGVQAIELGAGLGLATVVAAWLGADATATDGDADLVALLRSNLKSNAAPPPARAARAAVLRFGDAAAAAALPPPGAPGRLILLSDVIYGSDPSVWERLAATLAGLLAAGPALALQAETPRLEGVLYHEYAAALRAAGLEAAEAPAAALRDGAGPPGGVRLWAISRRCKPV